jgi:predicted 2-oxoglutarate/Fe(II)-dependent dioxygenase YbiX
MTRTAKAPTDFQHKLLGALAQVDRPGSVFVSGDLPLTMPGLEVDQVGAIRLPLGSTQARQLIKQCSQAPYGKGTQTLVDTDVRRVWELDPEQFKLTNPKWNDLVSSITGEVQQALGLEERKLTAQLYKLLVYEKGSFFLAHRDGEKLDGMVATLVVALPSRHTGGELIVSHEGRQHQVTLSGAASGLELSYAAFYADCEHEVRPVKDGYRLCLAYNLTLARSRGKEGITAPRTGAAVAALGELLGHWPQGAVQKFAIALDHQYSQEGLKIDTLKGVDRARADVLFDAAEQTGCVAHLALLTHWQSGSAEGGDYDDYSYRRRRRYGDWSDEEEEEGETSSLSGYEMGEVFDEGLSANHWSDRDGKQILLGQIGLEEQEVVASQPPEAWTISREEFEGYTGNAGMTLERWYYRAAVVIWPQRNHFQVLCGAGTDAAIAGLEAMVQQWKRARKSDEERQRQSCVQFAGAIIDTWSPSRYQYPGRSQDRIDRSLFPRLLQELDAPELVRRFLAQVMPQDGGVQLDKPFLTFGRKHGWAIFAESLTGLMDGSLAETIARNAALLEMLCLDRHKDADRVGLCQRLAEHAVAALERLDGDAPKHDWRMRAIDRAALLTALVKALVAVEAEKSLARLIDHTLVAGGRYDLTDVHLKAIFGLEAWMIRKLNKPSGAISQWLKHCRTELEQRTARAPTPPADFRRADKLSCKCGDCRQLSRFLADPHQSVLRLPLAKDRRQHLHQVIEACGCDLTHVTTRKGRPYALVCTKTTASYEKARQVYLRDCENLKRLQAIEERIDPSPKG